jgi:hypothetical protein
MGKSRDRYIEKSGHRKSERAKNRVVKDIPPALFNSEFIASNPATKLYSGLSTAFYGFFEEGSLQ